MKHRVKKSTMLFAATCGALVMQPACAQEKEEVKADSGGLQEVVVTAQRRGRAENVQNVPISVSAFSGEALEQLQIKNIEELSQYTPSLHVFAENVGAVFYTIRGLGRTSEDLSADPGVAVFLNDQYMARQASSNLGFYDVERVEVLKGPQGTLYGKNATAGAISVISREPTRERSGYVQLEAGNYGRFNFKGAISGALVDDVVYGRLAVTSENRKGLYKNLTTGETANNVDARGVRGTLKFTPSKQLTVNVIADWEKSDQKGVLKSVITDVPGTPYEFFLHGRTGQVRPGVTPLPTQEADPLTSRSGINGRQGAETHGLVANVRYAAPAFDLISITGYRGENNTTLEDLGRVPGTTAYTNTDQRTWSASQELRLVSNKPNYQGTENRFSWTAGLYFFHEEGWRKHSYYWNVAPFSSITTFNQDIDTNSAAAFGEVHYRLMDRLMLTGGLRMTTETKRLGVLATSVPIPGVAGAADASPFIDANYDTQVSKRWNKTSPKMVLNYQVADRVLAYGSISKGFKSGGFQGESPTPPLGTFEPEDVLNYEIGFKGEFLQRRLRFNAAVFYSDYTNLQLQTFDKNGAPTTSSADASSKGFEVELKARVSDALTLGISGSSTNARYKQFIDVQPGFSDAAHTFDLSGQPLALVPSYDISATAEYQFSIGQHGTLALQANIVAVDKTVTGFDSLWSPKYSKGDMRLVWEPNGSWRLTGWVNNVTDKLYYRGGGPVSKYNTKLVRLGLVSDPRTFGLTANYTF